MESDYHEVVAFFVILHDIRPNIMTKYFLILFSITCVHGCIPSTRSCPTVIKEINNEDITIQWLSKTGLNSQKNDIIIAKTKKLVDTICIADNIVDISFYNGILGECNIIVIGFLGTPHKNTQQTEIKNKTFDYQILPDKNYFEVIYMNERKIIHGGIIDKESSTWHNFDEQKERYTPTLDDVRYTEKILTDSIVYIKRKEPAHSDFITKNLNRYLRQYVGYINKNGDKIVWINFLYKNDRFINTAYLNDAVITVNDGGEYYWSIKVNITKNKLYDIAVNGEA